MNTILNTIRLSEKSGPLREASSIKKGPEVHRTRIFPWAGGDLKDTGRGAGDGEAGFLSAGKTLSNNGVEEFETFQILSSKVTQIVSFRGILSRLKQMVIRLKSFNLLKIKDLIGFESSELINGIGIALYTSKPNTLEF